MAKGIGIHIGLNAVDPAHYEGWSGDLNACEADAKDMASIGKVSGFTSSTLLTNAATRAAVQKAVGDAATKLIAGDILFLTYSGHGGQLPDAAAEEDDGLDETWCLFDGQMVDDEIFLLLGKLAAGVRVLVLSDSCHSGSVIKAVKIKAAMMSPGPRPRAMPDEIVQRVYLANKSFYDGILSDKALAAAEKSMKASSLLISGCQDNQLSMDGPFNGAFTGMLKVVWNGGKFSGNYREFTDAIIAKLPDSQTPNYFRTGAINAAFEAQKPFTL